MEVASGKNRQNTKENAKIWQYLLKATTRVAHTESPGFCFWYLVDGSIPKPSQPIIFLRNLQALARTDS